MTLMRETPKDHGQLLDHDPKGHRRHAPLRKQLVVRLPPEPQPPPQSAGCFDAAVRVMALPGRIKEIGMLWGCRLAPERR